MEQFILGVRCCLPDCGWEKREPKEQPLTPEGVANAYVHVWDHFVIMHGLDPDKANIPGIEEAAWEVILTYGCLRIEMKAK